MHMALEDRTLFLHVVLTKGTDTRSWHLGRSTLAHQLIFRRSEPGSMSSGPLTTDEGVNAKRQEFETEIATARADGWR